MKHKVAELDGALLDAAVAKAEGHELDSDGDNLSIRESSGRPSAWHPATDWSRGGPIIERERIHIGHGWLRDPDLWAAAVGFGFGDEVWRTDQIDGVGPTPLVAAMRAYVASKFGDEVEID